MPHVAPPLVAATLVAATLAWPHAATPRHPGAMAPQVTAAAADTVLRFRLEDQFGRVHTPARYAGAPMFIVAADQGGRTVAREWALALTAELTAAGAQQRIAVLPVADLRRVPRLLRRLVRGRFPKQDGEQVLLDWEGTLARGYGFTPDECTVLLVGPAGELVRRTSATVVDSALVREFARQALNGGR
jgi:hypothetical protein